MKHLLTSTLAVTVVFAGSAIAQQPKPLSAEASDPRIPGWMQGFPPAADQTIRFSDADAVRKHASFTLPESLDPTYDKQDLPFAKQDSLPRPLYFNTEVVFCRARKLVADVDAGALPVEGRVIR